MIYKVGMLVKHFKGTSLLDKNIYRILKLNVRGKDVDTSVVTYTGDGVLENAYGLVVYENVFQEGKVFAREYNDISSELSFDKQEYYHQRFKVEPLTEAETELVNNPNFIEKKTELTKERFN